MTDLEPVERLLDESAPPWQGAAVNPPQSLLRLDQMRA